MTKKMLINATHLEENRVAIVEDGILSELDIEIAGKEQTRGNIYKASVVRIEPGLQAAFVDYGAERFGFLQIGEIHPKYLRDGNGNSRPNISEILRRGQELLVQVVKEERGTKGAALTTYLSLPGRYMVLMPGTNTKGISRKIEEEPERKKLKEAMNSLDLPPDMGYIVRTAGIGQPNEELKRDFDYLVRVYRNIEEQASKVRSPTLIYKESNLVIRVIRDYFTSDMDEVLVDDPKVAEEARDFFEQIMPEYARLVKLHQERRPIFSRFQIEEQIETISKNKVAMPSGGSIVIDPTEALVAIDVNSGKMAGEQGVESTAFKTNLEAAKEVARQLRLRDLGGLIVIDFIDMRDRKHIREVEKTLKDGLKTDKARVTVGRISQFGLLEMSRQRIRAALAEGSFLTCPQCQGSGRIKSPEAQAIAFLRKIHAAVSKGQIGRVEGEVPLEVANYLLNTKREELLEMERRHQITISIKGLAGLNAGESELTVHKRGKEEPVEVPLVSPVLSPPPEAEQNAETEEEPEETAEAAASEGEAEQNRKKRKRRRRRKKTEEAPSESPIEAQQTSAPQAQPEAVVSQSVEDQVPAYEPVPREEETAATGQGSVQQVGEPESEEQAEEVKKKRRRRRRRKPSSEETEALEAAEAHSEQPSAEAEEAPRPLVEAPAERIEEKEIASAPETKLPEPLPSAEQLSERPAAPVEEIGTDHPPALPQTEPSPALISEQKEEKPTPRRRKRPAKKPVTESAEQKIESVQEDQKPEEEKPAAEKTAKSRAKPKATAAEPVDAEREAEPSPALTSDQGAAEEAKPKRRSPRRRKPAAKMQETAAEEAGESGGADLKEGSSAGEAGATEKEAAEEKKKTPRRATRKKKEEATAGSAESTETAQEPEKKESNDKPAPKKPARRRTPARKKTPEKESSASDQGSTDQPPQE